MPSLVSKTNWIFLPRARWLYLFILALAVSGFYQIFSFWFFHGWETSWLLGLTGGDFSLLNLMKSHGFVMYFNLLLFGWNPTGWYLTALIFHILVCWTLLYFVSKITKSLILGFLSSLIFVTTTAHHDVVTWGSFESLYAVQTLGFYVALIFFYKFRKTKKYLYIASCIVIFLMSIVLRESGLIFIPVVFLFDLIILNREVFFSLLKRKIKKSQLISFLLPHILFWFIAIVYLLIWRSYGGSAHDYIDERVQFRLLLFNEGRVVEYVKYSLLAFGQYIPPYITPYTFVNTLKELTVKIMPYEIFHYYFNVIFGWGLYILFVFMLFLQKKSKYFHYLLFCFSAFTVITIFYSFAWTMKPSFFLIPYSWSENRWRYLAFTMLAPFLVISLFWVFNALSRIWKLKSEYFILAPYLVIIGYVVVNFWQLQVVQRDMYLQNSFPSRRFYETLIEAFPTINEGDKFYFSRNSPGLNDYFSEFSFIRQEFYPNLKKIPQPWATNDMYYALKRYKDGEKILFADFSVDKGVLNETENVKTLFSSQKTIFVKPEKDTEGNYFIETNDFLPVEFRNNIKLTYRMDITSNLNVEKFPLDYLRGLSAFSNDVSFGIQNYDLKVCKTMGDPREPFYDFRESFVIDGNLSRRSYWWADCRPAWIEIDLKSQREISGFTWGSYNDEGAVPRHYEYEISSDGKTWDKVLEIKENNKSDRIDMLDNEVSARYIRFNVLETTYRAMLILNEFSPVFSSSDVVLADNDSQRQLYDSIYSLWADAGRNQAEVLAEELPPIAWAKITWTTKPENQVPLEDRTYYIPLLANGNMNTYSFQIAESEYYSTTGQFLDRYIKSINITAAPSTDLEIFNVEFIPLQVP